MTVTDIRDITSFKWATVVDTDPLRIQLDGDSGPLALIPDSLVDPARQFVGARVRVELSLRKVVVHGISQGAPLPTDTPDRGTSAERDALFGVPADNAARVALANQKVVWFNTDTSWHESYYAPTGLAGLTAPALTGAAAAGWYPIGEGPYSKHIASGIQAVVNNTYITNWSNWGVNGSVRRGGADWFTYSSGRVSIKKAGMYEVFIMTMQQSGSGSTVTHMMLGSNSIMQHTNTLHPTYSTPVQLYRGNVGLLPTDEISYFSEIGTYNLHDSSGNIQRRGEFVIRYKGPYLVTD